MDEGLDGKERGGGLWREVGFEVEGLGFRGGGECVDRTGWLEKRVPSIACWRSNSKDKDQGQVFHIERNRNMMVLCNSIPPSYLISFSQILNNLSGKI